MRTAELLLAIAALLVGPGTTAAGGRPGAPAVQPAKPSVQPVAPKERPTLASTACPPGQRPFTPVVRCAPNARCAAPKTLCMRPGNRLCPKGQVWKTTCPPGVLCLLGGRCVNAGKGPRTGDCPPRTRATPVACLRAPCPKICMPAGPVARPRHIPKSLKVKPL